MELLIFHFAHLVPRIDRLFQRRLRDVIPDRHALLADPSGTLARQEIVIGPLRRFIFASVLVFLPMSIMCCVLSFGEEESARLRPDGKRETVPVFAYLAGWVACGVILTVLLERMVRGGSVILREHGAVIRRRGSSVFVPWSAFRLFRASRTTNDWWILPVPADAKDKILLSRNGHLAARGQDVATSQFYFRRAGDAVVMNLYAVKFDELQRLLAELGVRLAEKELKRAPTEIGEPVPEDLC